MTALPIGWAETPLSAICAATEQVEPSHEFFYVDIGSIDRSRKRIVEPQRLSAEDAPSRARKLIRSGDTLVSMTRPNLNAVAIVPPELDGQIASTGFEVLRTPGIDPRWIGYLVRTEKFVSNMTSLVQGALYPAVRAKDVRAYVAPIAPHAEQRRIADKLDTVLARVDSVNDRLARVAPLLKRFRQSVLAAAVSGQLTDEAVDWQRAKLSSLVRESTTGLVRAAAEQSTLEAGSTPYLKMDGIHADWGHALDGFVDVRCTEEELNKYELRSGDWLFNTRNSLELVGKSCVWRGPSGVVFNNNILRVRFIELVRPTWVEIFFRSPRGRELLTSVKSATTSVAAIYQRALMSLDITLPPIEIQDSLIQRVEVLLAYADRLEARLRAAQASSGRLTPALLAKAFRGELVPQDPTDEPASELLRRLAVQQGGEAAKARGRGRRPASP